MPPIEGMTVEPMGWRLDGGYMWSGFIQWAIGQDELIDKFHKETGNDLRVLVGRMPFEQMIDEATGRDRAMILAWLDWVTVEMYGVEE